MGRPRMPMGGMGNMNSMIKQAQKMQQDMQKKQAELNASTFTAQAGGGMVTVTVYGTKEIKSIELKPEVVDPDDIEMLQDLIVAGVNAAIKEASDTVEREMSKLTGGMNLGF